MRPYEKPSPDFDGKVSSSTVIDAAAKLLLKLLFQELTSSQWP
jgi:hypothetical protein